VLDSGGGFPAFGLMLLALALVTLMGAVLLLPAPPGRVNASRAADEGSAGSLALIRRTRVQMLVGIRFLPTIYYAMLGMLIPLLINRVAGNKSTVALYASASLIVASTAQLAAGRAADRFGRRGPALIGFGTLMLSALGLAAFADELWGLFAFGVLGNAAAWAIAALMFCFVSDGVVQAEHGRVFGLLHASWSAAMIAGSLLGGALLRVGVGLPFLVGGLLNGAAVFLVLAYLTQLRDDAQQPRARYEAASAKGR
jgi:MFS family permease